MRSVVECRLESSPGTISLPTLAVSAPAPRLEGLCPGSTEFGSLGGPDRDLVLEHAAGAVRDDLSEAGRG